MTTQYLGKGIERRRRKLYAVLDVPQALRAKLGKRRFVQSLKTDSPAVARRRAAVLIADWKTQIEAAREDKPIDDAAFFRQALQRASNPEQRLAALRAIEIEADNKASFTVEGGPHNPPRPSEVAEIAKAAHEEADAFVSLATGKTIRLMDHIDDWLAVSHFSPRVASQAGREIELFAGVFPTADSLNKKDVQAYIREASTSIARGTIKKKLSYWRSLWRYLQESEIVSEAVDPFAGVKLPKAPKNGNGDKRQPFSREDVKKLIEAAESQGKTSLRQVIMLAAYTGARFSELTSLRIEDVSAEAFHIKGGKTDAAEREIPIHSALKPLVSRLVAESKDGWLLEGPGLTVDSLGERGRTLGKSFAVFKKALGYDNRVVFHSIRKTVATQFEEAKIPEFIAARILGHALKTMSYGLYSGGVDLETKREAIEAIHY